MLREAPGAPGPCGRRVPCHRAGQTDNVMQRLTAVAFFPGEWRNASTARRLLNAVQGLSAHWLTEISVAAPHWGPHIKGVAMQTTTVLFLALIGGTEVVLHSICFGKMGQSNIF